MVTIDVVGQPIPQGSKNAWVVDGRAILSDPKGVKPWREAVAQAARDYQAEHPQALLDGPLDVDITFRLQRPKSAPRRRLYPDTKPDLDKLNRAILDALTGTLIVNDSRVVVLTSRKVFAVDEPLGARITVQVIADAGVLL